MARNGDLLAIEIKPPKATTTITWAPLQVRHYADLFTEWARSADDPVAILQQMVHQRVDLGLASEVARPMQQPVRVRPVIALGRGFSQTALRRLKEVQRRVIEAGLDDPPLEVRSLSLTGRLGPPL